jgi:hypothetical protein
MKKNICLLLQVAWLILAIFTTHNSILALNGGASYCSGMYCVGDNDCGAPCLCNSSDFKCYDAADQSKS